MRHSISPRIGSNQLKESLVQSVRRTNGARVALQFDSFFPFLALCRTFASARNDANIRATVNTTTIAMSNPYASGTRRLSTSTHAMIPTMLATNTSNPRLVLKNMYCRSMVPSSFFTKIVSSISAESKGHSPERCVKRKPAHNRDQTCLRPMRNMMPNARQIAELTTQNVELLPGK